MITVTLATKRVFQTVGRNGLPEGKALRLVRAGRTEDGALRVGIHVGESEVTDRPVIHEGRAVRKGRGVGLFKGDGGLRWVRLRPARRGARRGGRRLPEHPMGEERPARIGTMGGGLGCLGIEEA